MADDLPSFGTDEEKFYRFLPFKGKLFRFWVKAAHNCHLAFTNAEEEGEPMFEVFIGGWEGAASAIRFNKGDDLIKVDTPDILSEDEFREFWVSFDNNEVRVGKAEEWEPFMESALPEPVEVSYVAYSTGWGANGWYKFGHMKEYATENSPACIFEPLYGEHFTFSVSCGNDAHIAFTSAPEETQPMYEVFLGGWQNQNSAIRLDKDKEKTVVKVDTPDIVCSEEERSFWVNLRGGNLRVGYAGNPDPFMEYDNPEPFKPTYVGICTSYGATGTWKLNV